MVRSGTMWVEGNLDDVIQNVKRTVSGFGMSDFLNNEGLDLLRDRARDRFASEGDDASGAWVPLKESTNFIRRAKGYPAEHPINVRSGELRSYVLTSPAMIQANADMAVMKWPGPASGELLQKLSTAQQGRVDPSTVARPVVSLSVADLVLMQERLVDYIIIRGGRR